MPRNLKVNQNKLQSKIMVSDADLNHSNESQSLDSERNLNAIELHSINPEIEI